VKAVILAAGYATRLYPLTLDRPKALLPVGGRPMVEHVVGRLATMPEVDEILLVTNAKFAQQFAEWSAAYTPPRPGLAPRIIDDGTTDESNRLGANGDLAFVIESAGIDDDLVVIASDNLFDESLEGFAAVCRERQAPVVVLTDIGDLAEMPKYSMVDVDGEGRLTSFVEKPAEPTSTLSCIALYHYPRQALGEIRRYLDEGNNPDQPGRFVAWLFPQQPVYTWRLDGIWYDIGGFEALGEADRLFTESAQS
jgi:glucose-1-phosphate thymidylyltransferase